MKTKTIWLVALLTIVLLSMNALLGNYQLRKGFEQSQGHIVRVSFGGKGGGGGGIQYTYEKSKSQYQLLMGADLKCRNMIEKKLKKLQKIKFPVVYLPSNHQNARILLFESQYIRYGVDIPEHLVEIVKELSECEK